MKRYAPLVTAIVALATLMGTTAVADDAQSQLQAAYDGQCKAGLARDATAFGKFFAPTYVDTDIDGSQQDLTQTIAGVVTPQVGVTFSTCSFTIRKVTTDGAKATALVTQHVTGTFAQGGGEAQPFTQVQDSTDAWNIAGAPVELSSTETGHRLTIAGKVVEEKGTMSQP